MVQFPLVCVQVFYRHPNAHHTEYERDELSLAKKEFFGPLIRGLMIPLFTAPHPVGGGGGGAVCLMVLFLGCRKRAFEMSALLSSLVIIRGVHNLGIPVY